MEKYLVFDMDNTIVDFYGVEDWKHYLDDLQDTTPYRIAKPLYDMELLNSIVSQVQEAGYKIFVVSWLSRVNTDRTFHGRVTSAKLTWLKKYGFPYDCAMFLDYGADKYEAVSHFKGEKILIDDNDEVLNAWKEAKIDAKMDIIPALSALLESERKAA